MSAAPKRPPRPRPSADRPRAGAHFHREAACIPRWTGRQGPDCGVVGCRRHRGGHRVHDVVPCDTSGAPFQHRCSFPCGRRMAPPQHGDALLDSHLVLLAVLHRPVSGQRPETELRMDLADDPAGLRVIAEQAINLPALGNDGPCLLADTPARRPEALLLGALVFDGVEHRSRRRREHAAAAGAQLAAGEVIALPPAGSVRQPYRNIDVEAGRFACVTYQLLKGPHDSATRDSGRLQLDEEPARWASVNPDRQNGRRLGGRLASHVFILWHRR